MSAKRPPKRYVGLRFTPEAATRREVASAVEAAWKAGAPPGPAPRLLVCESGAAIVVVPRGDERAARAAFSAAPAGARVRLTSVVTSGTIASVKARLRLPRGR